MRLLRALLLLLLYLNSDSSASAFSLPVALPRSSEDLMSSVFFSRPLLTPLPS